MALVINWVGMNYYPTAGNFKWNIENRNTNRFTVFISF
jgi:hypothetical protein